MMCFTSGNVTLREVQYCVSACFTGLAMPSPPSRVGRAAKSRTLSLNVFWPEIPVKSNATANGRYQALFPSPA